MFQMIICTAGSNEEAEKITGILLEKSLVACVQIMPIQSHYKWNDKLYKSNEYMMFIKTKSEKFKEIEKTIKENHSYEVPEIIATNIENVFPPYADFINESVTCHAK